MVVGGDVVGKFVAVELDVAVKVGHGVGVVPNSEFECGLGSWRGWSGDGQEGEEDDGEDGELHCCCGGCREN